MNIDKLSKKITVVSQFWPPNFVGGGEISTYYVCQQLAKMGYKISIMTPSSSPVNNKFPKLVKLINPKSIFEPFEERYFNNIMLNQKLNDGIFWATDFYGAASLKNINVKKIVTVRDYWPICGFAQSVLSDYSSCGGCNFKNLIKCSKIKESNFPQKIIRSLKYLYNNPFRRSILPQFNYVVFISHHLAKQITPQILLKTYSVIYNPLSIEYVDKKIKKGKINHQILFAGTVENYKGITVLLEAVKEIIVINKNIFLLILGAGNINTYQKRVKKLGLSKNVKFLGKIPYNEVIDYFDKCDMVIIPSLRPEPFGRTVIEGMARKCIPIATNQGGPAEIIKDRETGFLFERRNYDQLAKIIINLYENPETMKTVQEKARNFAVKNFSPEKITQKYEKIFNSI